MSWWQGLFLNGPLIFLLFLQIAVINPWRHAQKERREPRKERKGDGRARGSERAAAVEESRHGLSWKEKSSCFWRRKRRGGPCWDLLLRALLLGGHRAAGIPRASCYSSFARRGDSSRLRVIARRRKSHDRRRDWRSGRMERSVWRLATPVVRGGACCQLVRGCSAPACHAVLPHTETFETLNTATLYKHHMIPAFRRIFVRVPLSPRLAIVPRVRRTHRRESARPQAQTVSLNYFRRPAAAPNN